MADEMKNPFIHRSAAERYARARPYHQPVVVERLRRYLRVREPVARALDVACGTGQSCTALKVVARHVVGVDAAAAMLAHATPGPDIEYVEAHAERLPFADGDFDLVTAGSAFHWFDRARFLREAHRVLRAGCWLVVYENHFRPGAARECPAFEPWFRRAFVPRYPAPPRDRSPLDDAQTEAAGFRFAHRERYSNEVTYTRDELIDYLTTQSGIVAAVEHGDATLEDARAWMSSTLEPVFAGHAIRFGFGGEIWYLQRR